MCQKVLLILPTSIHANGIMSRDQRRNGPPTIFTGSGSGQMGAHGERLAIFPSRPLPAVAAEQAVLVPIQASLVRKASGQDRSWHRNRLVDLPAFYSESSTACHFGACIAILSVL